MDFVMIKKTEIYVKDISVYILSRDEEESSSL